MTAPAMVVPDLFLAEIDHYNPDEEAVETLTVATSEYRTGPDRTNLVRQSQAMNTTPWGKTAGITVTENAAEAPDGTMTANFIENAAGLTSENINQSVTFTGDGEKCASVFLKAGTATQTDVNIRDTTAGVNRHIINVAWSNGIPTVTSQSGSGQAFPARPVPNRPGWWRVALTATDIVAANAHSLHIYPTGTGQIAGDVYAWGAQAEDASGPSDYIKTTTVAVTRPNPNVVYDPILLQPGNVRRDMFDIGTTSGPSRTALGNIEVNNAEGLLDALIDHGFDARGIRLYRAPSIPRPEYPLGFTTELVASMQDGEFIGNRISFPLRDELRALSVPIQTAKFAGDNVGPDGLEGTQELRGKPIPILLGRRRNVRAVCVNAVKNIWRIHDSALQSVEDVYDSGIALTEAFKFAARTSFAAVTINAVAHNGSDLFVAGGNASGGAPVLASSPDGVTWTSRTPAGFGGEAITAIDHDQSALWVAVGSAGGMGSSADGITWTSRTSTFGSTFIRDIAFGGGRWVAVGNLDKIAFSTTGTSWTATAGDGSGTTQWDCVAWGNGLFVAISNQGKMIVSVDGNVWTPIVSPFESSGSIAPDITYGNGYFVAVYAGADASDVAYSTDGTSWTVVETGTNGATVAAGDGFFCRTELFGGTSDSLSFAVRPDVWTPVEDDVFTGVKDIAFGDGVFVAVGNGGEIGSTETVTFASAADLEDDELAPPAGTYKTYLAGGYFRLGSSPVGEVTCDASEGANAAARTAAQLAVRVFERMGYTTGDWSAADVTAHDAASDYEMGLYIDEETTARDVLNQLMAPRSSVFQDAAGVLRIKQLTLPTGAPVLELTASDFKRPLERIRTRDTDRGIPPHRCIVKYSRNGVVQTSGLAAGVADDRRALLAQEWLTVEANDPDILDVHPLAQERTDETCICDQADAETEVAALLTLRGTRRDYFVGTIERNAQTSALELNDIVQVTVPRYGMENGKKFRVLSLDKKNDAKEIEISLWGGVAA